MFFTQGLHRAIQRHPDSVATVFGDRRQSFIELHGRVARLAGGLAGLGVRAGNPVAIMALSSDRYLESILAVPWLGALIVPIDLDRSFPDIVFALQDSESVAVFMDDKFAEHLDEILDACPFLRYVIYLGDGPIPEGARHLEELIAAFPEIPDASLADATDGAETLGIFYADRTPEGARGILLTQRAACASALALLAEGVFSERCIALHCLPLWHPAEVVLAVALLLRGSTQVVLSEITPQAAAQAIRDHQVTDLLLAAGSEESLLADRPGESFEFQSLQNILTLASSVGEIRPSAVAKDRPNVRCCQIYGRTEMASVTFVHFGDRSRPDAVLHGQSRAVGRVACHVHVRIADRHGGSVPSGQIGAVLVRGASCMQGYWHDHEATREAMRDGWVRTGDHGFMDSQGSVHLLEPTGQADRLG